MEQRIVCAAERHKLTKQLILGVRHSDELMHTQIDTTFNHNWESGFVDNRGQFLTRTEAWKVAHEADQIIRRCGGDDTNGGTLYSENLY